MDVDEISKDVVRIMVANKTMECGNTLIRVQKQKFAIVAQTCLELENSKRQDAKTGIST